ncbi:alpha/beta hydrolase [Nocardioides humilatus]|uniref:Alpha/beta hydrolase n=1 Tax=Nocardioides humilatus TaxID=2607660 RepID=A0A5B1LE68_9ACTN|nr:alpha/beta hydrolase [Nocardioides humilatus]KAA1419013.1 alpha/beta hydrolase [Nocardioides humilatus]
MLPSLDEWIAGGGFAEVDGHRIFVRQDASPDGVPVTLLHGFPTSSHDWAGVVPALVKAGCRVTTLDFLGLGASDKPNPHDYRIVEQADIVEAIWDQLGIGRTALVAHDYGVSVGQELLSRNAQRITSMSWLNGGLYPDLHRPVLMQKLLHGRLGPVLARLGTERTFRSVMGSIMGREVSDSDLHAMWASVTTNDGRRVQPAVLKYIDERRLHADRWREALEGYSGPTQFIWGPADPISGGHVLERLLERLPDAEYVVLDDEPVTGHYPQVENPTVVAEALARFLNAYRGA